MVDDHEGLQAVAVVAELDHPHAVSLVMARMDVANSAAIEPTTAQDPGQCLTAALID